MSLLCLPSIAPARWTAEKQWLVFIQPGVEQCFMPDGVDGGNDQVTGIDFTPFELDRRHFHQPRFPFAFGIHLGENDRDSLETSKSRSLRSR